MRVLARCQLLGLTQLASKRSMEAAAEKMKLPPQRLEALLHPFARPLEHEVRQLAEALGLPTAHIRLVFGAVDRDLQERLAENAEAIASLMPPSQQVRSEPRALKPCFKSSFGRLYQADCLEVLSELDSDSIDLVFADPPFNLKKIYESGIDDDLSETAYLDWCERWIDECCRVLKPGGSFFLWNIPKWCTHLSGMLNSRLTFRNWIAVDIKYSLPISRKLYPSHYGLLYYIKGESPDVFAPDRMPMATCPSCGKELKDYGGYKSKMNPRGINLGDVWTDISPVRHSKHKKRKEANELPIKLLDRIIELATTEGQTIFDPFGGAGTTYAVAEIKKRRWIGVEIGSADQIVDRLNNLDDEAERLRTIRASYNHLFPPAVHALRKSRGHWTCDDFCSDKDKEEVFEGSLFGDQASPKE